MQCTVVFAPINAQQTVLGAAASPSTCLPEANTVLNMDKFHFECNFCAVILVHGSTL